MQDPIVTLTQCSDYSSPRISEAIAKHFSLLGGLDKFISPGDSVLLKPNFIAPKPRHYATQTDPAVIIETARLIKDFGAKPFVADSPGWADVHACARALKLDEPLKKLSVPIKQLNKPTSCRINDENTKIGISSIALEADVIINLPKFKAHQQLVATFAVKNMFGCISGKRKALCHFTKGKDANKFCRMLIDIYRFLSPVITIIDAVTAMEGQGPISGTPRDLGWIIGGTDPIACEVVCTQLIGIEPESLPIVKTAKQIGFGCSNLENIQIAGDDFSQNPCSDFQMPEMTQLRFSLPHVCKSICKQIVLLVKPPKK